MSSPGGAVGFTDDHVGVHLWLIVLQCDIAQAGNHLHLLADPNPLVFLGLPIEIADHHARERSNRREVAGVQVTFLGKCSQSGRYLVAGFEDYGECLGARIQEFRFHPSLRMVRAASHTAASAAPTLRAVRKPVRMESGFTYV